jgi:molybdopterin-binding protein
MGMVLNRNLLAHYMQKGSSNYRLDIHAQNILVGMVCMVLVGTVLGMVSEDMALGTVLVHMASEDMVSERMALGKMLVHMTSEFHLVG